MINEGNKRFKDANVMTINERNKHFKDANQSVEA